MLYFGKKLKLLFGLLLAAILEKATGQSLYDFARQNLFEPMGMHSAKIDVATQGIGDGGNGIWLNVYDMAKFGSLLPAITPAAAVFTGSL